MDKILECVPNFSEGRDMSIIDSICGAIESVAGVRVLHVDAGYGVNRTVVTLAGEPEGVVESAFLATKMAMERIDMRRHSGEHPRIGATDVLPLVPVKGITLARAAEMARSLGRRIGEELGIPVYLYEAAAAVAPRGDLAFCRKGEYEGLRHKISTPEGRPDFGPAQFTDIAARAGATVVGARDFLIAVNFNLDTDSVDTATDIAMEIRERGRIKQIAGAPIREPGRLKGTKAIGWYVAEYGFAQVSVNIVDLAAAPLHIVFEAVARAAHARGVEVTGTEIIGLVPLKVLTDAGSYFAAKHNAKLMPTTEQQLDIAILAMGLSQLSPFTPRLRIVDYLV